jgi:peptidoglycan L-alanyl-D-glutamate endopeptidase CwlK
MPEVNRKPVFDVARQLLKTHAPEWITFTTAEVKLMDAAIDVVIAPFEQTTAPVQANEIASSGYKLGEKSQQKLLYLHPRLREVVELAITYTTQDFTVLEVLRTLEAQRKAVASRNSRTMKSKHLRQPDGWSWAVDLGAWVGGAVSWKFDLYPKIAWAMDRAATKLGVASHVRWGCAWDRVLSDFGGDEKAYHAEVKAYAARHPGSDLLDGPHFEWVA